MNDLPDTDHQDLLQFLYQCPFGLISLDEAGVVSLINPTASRLLTVELVDGESVATPLPVLQRLVPELMSELLSDGGRLGSIGSSRGDIVDSVDGRTRFTVAAHRIRRGQIVITLTDVSEERRLLAEQRRRSRRLQQALLGRIDLTDLEVSVSYQPAHREDLSGGDWYDVIDLGGGRHGLVVGDVVGHDIEASATMGQLRAVVRALAQIDPEPRHVLERTEAIARSIDAAACTTLHYAVLDSGRSTLTYASAGHPPPLLIRSTGEPELLEAGRGPALAALQDASHDQAEATVDPGDIVVLYSDGLIERREESIDVGLARLRDTAASLPASFTTDDVVHALTDQMLYGVERRDDVCALAVRYAPDVRAKSRTDDRVYSST